MLHMFDSHSVPRILLFFFFNINAIEYWNLNLSFPHNLKLLKSWDKKKISIFKLFSNSSNSGEKKKKNTEEILKSFPTFNEVAVILISAHH